ncbi:MAG: hypothetical protein JNL72_00085 [Flavipsychrobacter sp.]|nr:hypothetical protein [Flavipsychrobacter sp.]
MRKIVLWALALCGPYIAAAQKDKNICACSGQALWGTANPQSRDLFDPALVKAARYKEATITLGHQSRGKDNMLSNTGSPYLYARYQFNDSGFVTRITEYYNGTPRYVSQYQRNAQNVVTRKLFSAADSAGNINTASYEYFAYQYYYEKGRLVQMNVIDKAYSDKPDILSRREYYEYDDGGREVRKRYVQRQRFSPARTDTTVETTRYSATGRLPDESGL